MKKYNIPISKPTLTREDRREILKCFDSSWISSKSPYVAKFEKRFSSLVAGTKYGAAVNSGTSAIFLALKSLGIGQGDEVIIPTLTMIATVNAVKWTGATPVLIDSTSENDWNMSVEEFQKKISKKTKAVIPVHLYGYPCAMDEITKIAKSNNIFVIEDAAEAMGSKYKGSKLGSLGDLSCFSLYANKIITTGNGGFVASNNEDYINKIKKISFFDFNKEEHFSHKMMAYNLVMTGLQAALGLSQLNKFKHLLSERKRVYREWEKKLLVEGINFIQPIKSQNPNYWFPAVLFDNQTKREKMERLLTQIGVDNRRFFRPVHLQKLYEEDYKKEKYPNAEHFFEKGLLLPSYSTLTNKSINDVCKLINENW